MTFNPQIQLFIHASLMVICVTSMVVIINSDFRNILTADFCTNQLENK